MANNEFLVASGILGLNVDEGFYVNVRSFVISQREVEDVCKRKEAPWG
jgi:hypothetical protein